MSCDNIALLISCAFVQLTANNSVLTVLWAFHVVKQKYSYMCTMHTS